MKQAKSLSHPSTVKTRIAACVFVLWLTQPITHALSIYDVHLDTTAFAGQSGIIPFLAFDLIDGDGTSGNNTVTVRWTPSFGQENAETKLGSQALLH